MVGSWSGSFTVVQIIRLKMSGIKHVGHDPVKDLKAHLITNTLNITEILGAAHIPIVKHTFK